MFISAFKLSIVKMQTVLVGILEITLKWYGVLVRRNKIEKKQNENKEMKGAKIIKM